MIWVGILATLVLALLMYQYKWVAENDKNGDGRVDEWLRFNLKKEKVEFRRDKNYDGEVDYIEKYKDGRLVNILVDFDYNGTFEIVSHYDPTNEKLTLLERDTNGDGVTDRKTIYEKGTGLPLKLVIDTDFDGEFDEEYDKRGE